MDYLDYYFYSFLKIFAKRQKLPVIKGNIFQSLNNFNFFVDIISW